MEDIIKLALERAKNYGLSKNQTEELKLFAERMHPNFLPEQTLKWIFDNVIEQFIYMKSFGNI